MLVSIGGVVGGLVGGRWSGWVCKVIFVSNPTSVEVEFGVLTTSIYILYTISSEF